MHRRFSVPLLVLFFGHHPVESLLLVVTQAHGKGVGGFGSGRVEVEGLCFLVEGVELVLLELLAVLWLVR